jgi:hypothetical protein
LFEKLSKPWALLFAFLFYAVGWIVIASILHVLGLRFGLSLWGRQLNFGRTVLTGIFWSVGMVGWNYWRLRKKEAPSILQLPLAGAGLVDRAGVEGCVAVVYPLMPKGESREVRCAIRRVFLEVWDPIRISDEANAQDEYDGYIGRVFELLVTGGSDKEIIEYLLWATERMGMDGSRVSLQAVTAALRQIPIPRAVKYRDPSG